jgi:hypothetical protein
MTYVSTPSPPTSEPITVREDELAIKALEIISRVGGRP